ncbi:MAG TPA: GNAT family N-acetyltransferase [Cytophagales bacterium]|nr:GNAT family N-acetyltransferase [Cytophagales bacterium]
MEIQREEHGSKGAFFISAQGKRLAEMTYSKAGDTRLIIDHTEVSDALKGKGAGKQLVTAAVNFARQQKIKILPLCPFARAVFEKTPEFADVWDN